MSLHLKRSRGRSVVIGTDVRVTVVSCVRGQVVLKIEAPAAVPVYRTEVLPPGHPMAPKPEAKT